MRIRFVPVFKVKINYKSGNSHTFECYSFQAKDGEIDYQPVSNKDVCLFIGIDDIESIYQVGLTRKLRMN